jgi:ATP-dependent DNA helicase RecQ
VTRAFRLKPEATPKLSPVGGMPVAAQLRVATRRKRPGLEDARRVLKKVFGLDEFRPGQEEIIRSVLEGRDTVAIMPTAAGKSLCYQVPGLLLRGRTVVVSPLMSAVRGHEDKFVVTTPERLATHELRADVRQLPVDLIVVDEAQSVSQRVQDFRPAYLGINDFIAGLGLADPELAKRPPILALTAPAPAEVIDDVVTALGIDGARVVNTGVYRPNLQYEVLQTANEPQRREHLVRLLREIDGAGIVYAATVRQVEVLYELLAGLGFDAAKYHGRLAPRQRKENEERFLSGSLHAMVATNAFGMGVDKPDVRFVIHYNMPGSLEAYYDESGRAGRDGERSRCVLFYQPEDRKAQPYFTSGRYPRAEEIGAVYDALERQGAADAPVPLARLKSAVDRVAPTAVRAIVSLLKDLGIVKELRGAHLRLLASGVSPGKLAAMADEYRSGRSTDREKLERMMAYAENAGCRWAFLLDYFGEHDHDLRCGICDNCHHPLEEQVSPPSERSQAADRPDR